jgi:hypothetical protein
MSVSKALRLRLSAAAEDGSAGFRSFGTQPAETFHGLSWFCLQTCLTLKGEPRS